MLKRCIYQNKHIANSIKGSRSFFRKSPPYKVSKPSELETVVIGGGVGGLLSAALLAKDGFPVTLVEQQAVAGGYIGAFERMGGKYRFEQTTHYAPLGEFSPILEELGINTEDLKLKYISESSRLKTPKYDIVLPVDEKELCKIIEREIPGESENVRKIYELARKTLEECIDLISKDMKVPKYQIPFKYPLTFKNYKKTLKQVIDPITTNEDVVDLLFGLLCIFRADVPSAVCSSVPLTSLAMLINKQMQVLTDTSQVYIDLLTQNIRESGGRILYGMRVKEINIDPDNKQRVQGVTLDSHSETHIPAKCIISNLNPISTFKHLIPNRTPSMCAYLKNLEGRQLTPGCLIVYLGLNKDIRGVLPNYENTVLGGEGRHRNYEQLRKGANAVYIANLYDHIQSPKRAGTSILNLVIFSEYGIWEEYSEDYKKGIKGAYNKKKQELADELVLRAEEDLVPGLRDMIEVMEVSTPLTNIRYTGSPNGACLGFRLTPQQSNVDPVLTRTPVKGLYFANSWLQMGCGVVQASVAGNMAFKAIKQDYRL